MIIECPVCPKPAPRYRIDAALIGAAGREVRCPRCGHEWFVSAPEASSGDAAAPDATSDATPLLASGAAEFPLHVSLPIIAPPEAVAFPNAGPRPLDAPLPESRLSGMQPEEAAPVPEAFAENGSGSAGAALALATMGWGAAGEAGGEPAGPAEDGVADAPLTAERIASLFFASSSEGFRHDHEDQDEERGEERGVPEQTEASFLLWGALDSVRPPEDEMNAGDAPGTQAPGAPPEPATAFHADFHEDFHGADNGAAPEPSDDPGGFHLPPSDERTAEASGWEEEKPSVLDGDAGAEPAFAPASDGAERGALHDEDLAAALASAADWGGSGRSFDPSDASRNAQPAQKQEPAPQAGGWASAEASAEIARLVQALQEQNTERQAGALDASPVWNEPASEAPADQDADHAAAYASQANSLGADDLGSDDDLDPGAKHLAPAFLRGRNPLREQAEAFDRPGEDAKGARPTRDLADDFDFPDDFPDGFGLPDGEARGRRPGGLLVAAAWGVFLTLLGGFALGFVHFREAIMARAPATAGLYAALGAPVALHASKLDFANVSYRWEQRGDRPVIAIEGDIISRSAEIEPVPALTVAIRDADDPIPESRIQGVEAEQVEPRGSAHFAFDVESPSGRVTEIAIAFVR